MSALAKVFVVFILLLSVTFFGTSATLYLTREDWAAKYEEYKAGAEEQFASLKDRIDRQKGMIDDQSAALANVSASERRLAVDYGKAQQTIRDKDAEIAQVKKERDDHLAAKTATDNENAALRNQVTKLTSDLQEASQSVADAIDKQKEADQRMFRMKRDLDETAKELHVARVEYQDLSQKFESQELQLAAIRNRVGDEAFTSLLTGAVPAIDALIEDVDSDLDIVVLSVGKNDDVKEGYEFTIYRADQFVGKVRINKVYDNLSGARVVYTANGLEISKGDRATTRIN